MNLFPKFQVSHDRSAKSAKIAKVNKSDFIKFSKISNFSSPQPKSVNNPLEVLPIPDMTLSEFERTGSLLEVHVPWHPQHLWFAPTEADARLLVSEGVNRGDIWTARELKDLLAIPGLSLKMIHTIHSVKAEFGGWLLNPPQNGRTPN